MRVSLRPDPRKGVFETLLVLDGQPVELDAHLERLNSSLDTLYEGDLPRGATNEVIARARAIRHGKLRLTVAPADDGELEAKIATAEVETEKVFPGPEFGARLRSVVVDEGLGDHKWADRRLLEDATAAQPGELPLIVNSDGAVLEASRGSVFAVLADGRLRTPATDGRILPSIARRRVLDVAPEAGIEVDEGTLSLAELSDAREVFLAGSIRGVEPVRSLDGAPLAQSSEISTRIAAGLRGRWLAVPQGESVAVVAGGRQAGPPVR